MLRRRNGSSAQMTRRVRDPDVFSATIPGTLLAQAGTVRNPNPPIAMFRIRVPLLLSALLAACSGGGGSTAPATTGSPGTVQVVLDTAADTPTIVQFQVNGVVFEDAGGRLTANVLPAPRMVRFTDPTGACDGLALRGVATGVYTALHLGIVPGSGTQLLPDGTVVPVSAPVDLRVPLAEDLRHDASGTSWVGIGHGRANAPAAGGAWTPALSGRLGGAAVRLDDLSVAFVGGNELTVRSRGFDDAPLHVVFGAGCELHDDDHGTAYGTPAAFVAATSVDDSVVAEGDVYQNGRFELRSAHRGHTGTRLIGRITALEPATTAFVMDVYAEARQGTFNLLPAVATARVFADGARIEGAGGHRTLAYGDLAQDQLVKVDWTTRTIVANGPDEFAAREIEVAPTGGLPMQPEWQGLVQSVDLQLRELTVVQRGNDPIVIGGVTYASVIVHVDAGVTIERRTNNGNGNGGRVTIAIEDIVAGSDAIWWRGEATSPGAVEASAVRVRATN